MITRPNLGRMNYLSAGRPGMQRTRPVQVAKPPTAPMPAPTAGINAPATYGGANVPARVQGPPIFAPGKSRM